MAFTSLFIDIIRSFVVHSQCSVLNVDERLLLWTGRIVPFVVEVPSRHQVSVRFYYHAEPLVM